MKEITPADILAADPDVQIVDVREAAELTSGMIEDAIHLPSGSVLERVDELDPARRVIVVCQVGARSRMVATALTELGFDADNLSGGMKLWEAEGMPTVPPEIEAED